MRYYVTVEGRVLEVEVDGDAARVEGAAGEARVLEGSRGPSLWVSVGGRPHRLYGVRRGATAWEIHFRGRSFQVDVADEMRWRRRRSGGGGTVAAAGLEPLRAPMPGLVLRVEVEKGQDVAQGQGLLIVEAMKMENELRAQAAGRVRHVRVAAGESVRRGDILVEFERAGEDGRDPARDDRDGAADDRPRTPGDSGRGPEP